MSPHIFHTGCCTDPSEQEPGQSTISSSLWDQPRLPELSGRLCMPSAPAPLTLLLAGKAPCWAAEGTLEHSTSPAEPQQSLRTGKQLWKGRVLPYPDPASLPAPSTAPSPQTLPQLLTLCPRDRKGTKGVQKHPEKCADNHSDPLPTPALILSSSLLPNLPASSPSPLPRVLLNIELR